MSVKPNFSNVELHSFIWTLCLASGMSGVFDSTQADLSLEIGVTVRTCVYACVGPRRGVDSRVVSSVSQSRGLGVSFGSGVLIFGCDWDFSARLRGCQHIRMLHSI